MLYPKYCQNNPERCRITNDTRCNSVYGSSNKIYFFLIKGQVKHGTSLKFYAKIVVGYILSLVYFSTLLKGLYKFLIIHLNGKLSAFLDGDIVFNYRTIG